MNLIEEHKRVTSRRADLFARVAISFRAGKYPFHKNPAGNSPSLFRERRSIALTRECNTKFEIFPLPGSLDFNGTEHERDLLSKIAKQLLDCRLSTLQKWRNSFRDLEKGIEKGWKLVTRSRNEEGRGDSLQWGRSCFFPPFFLLSRNWFRERWR